MTEPLTPAQRHEALMTGMGAAKARRDRQKALERKAQTMTDEGQQLLREAVGHMETAIDEFIRSSETGAGRRSDLLPWLKRVPNEVTALLTARLLLDSIALEKTLQRAAFAVGKAYRTELYCRWIKKEEPALWTDVTRKIRRTRTRQRAQLVNEIVVNEEFDVEWMDRRLLLRIGLTLVELFCQSTGLTWIEVLTDEKGVRGRVRKRSMVRATPETLAWLEYAAEQNEFLNPHYMPAIAPCKEWTNLRDGGYSGGMVRRKPLLKTWDKHHFEAVEATEMPEVYEAVNRVQGTGWRLNDVVHETFKAMWDEGTTEAGLPDRERLDIPKPPKKEEVSVEEWRTWRRYAAAMHGQNAMRASHFMQTTKVLFMARELEGHAFWYPQQLDFRGRIYCVPFYLHPQGNDLARGLLQFHEGKPLDTPGARRWLAIHGANCWGNDKVSHDDRVAWVEEHREFIEKVREDPLVYRWWVEADEPWQFLAFCLAWGDYLEQGEDAVCHLPVGMDGSNNGLQLYSLALRDPVGGYATNCMPADEPQDIYQDVADAVTAALKKDAGFETEERRQHAGFWLSFTGGRLPRSAAKRPVMTLPYGSTFFSCQRYVVDWFREECEDRAIKMDHSVSIHPKCTYLAELVWDAIGTTVVSARKAMDWLHGVASVLTKHGLDLQWTAPSGFPVQQRYTKYRSKIIETKVGDRSRRTRYREKQPDDLNGRKQAQGVAPNFVHSLDASVLMASVNAAGREGVTSFSMVHDSYGVLPADAECMARCLREACVDIFSVDVLEDFRQQALDRLPAGVTLPPTPDSGDMDIQDVLRSTYFFS